MSRAHEPEVVDVDSESEEKLSENSATEEEPSKEFITSIISPQEESPDENQPQHDETLPFEDSLQIYTPNETEPVHSGSKIEDGFSSVCLATPFDRS